MSNRALEARIHNAAPLFAALGDDLRLSLVARLSNGLPLSITRLSEGLPITRQGVTKHLHVLEQAGVVRASRAGREQQWQLEPESLEDAQRYLDLITRQWGSTLGRLKDFVEQK